MIWAGMRSWNQGLLGSYSRPKGSRRALLSSWTSSVILVPGLVFDAQGNRLGWGGGYYDRFLGGEGRGLPSIGLAFDLQIAEQALLAQAHDIPVDMVVTESRVIQRR